MRSMDSTKRVKKYKKGKNVKILMAKRFIDSDKLSRL